MKKYNLWVRKNLKENHIKNIKKLSRDLALLEKGMLKRGYDRRSINEACIQLILIEDSRITGELNEDFSDVVMGIVGKVAPGAKDYFKKEFLKFMLGGIGVPVDSKIGSFIVTAFKNVDFLNIVKYFKTGNCPKIVDLVVNTLSDELVKYVTSQIALGTESGSGTSNSAGQSSTNADSQESASSSSRSSDLIDTGDFGGGDSQGFKTKLAEALMRDLLSNSLNEQAEPTGFLASLAQGVGLDKVFGGDNTKKMMDNMKELTKGSFKDGVLQQILMDIIKNDLLPILKQKISDLICKGMDLSKFNKVVGDSFSRGQSQVSGQASASPSGEQPKEMTSGRVKQVSKPGQGGKRFDRA